MSKYTRPSITWGNDFTIKISLQQFLDGDYVDFNFKTVKSLEVYLICSAHDKPIPLKWEYEPGFDNIISCFVVYYTVHPNASYGICVEGVDENDKHFRWYMLPKEGILVVNNTSGQNIPTDIEVIDLHGRVGWGVEAEVDLSNYYTKQETNDLLDNKADISDLDRKQNTLVSGVNIKTINNQSILGPGNITIQASSHEFDDMLDYATDVYSYEGDIDDLEHTIIDNILGEIPYLDEKTNQMWKDINAEPNGLKYKVNNLQTSKQDVLVSGTNIKTINNESILGSGNIDIEVENNDEVTANALYELNEELNYTKKDVEAIPSVVDSKLNKLKTQVDESIETVNNAMTDLSTNVEATDLANALILNEIHNEIGDKQDVLVSGTDIKTINGNSLLGSGNITIGDANNLVYYGNIKIGYEPHTQSSYTVMTKNGIKSQAIYGDNLYYGISPEIYEEFNLDKVSSGNTQAHYSYNGYNEDGRVINKVYISGGGNSQYIYNDEWESVDTWPSWVTRWRDPHTQLYPYGVYKTFSSRYGNIYKTKNGSTDFDDIFIENPTSYSNITVTLIVEGYDGHYANVKTEINKKQDALVSGTNIKTINGTSLLGSGDITVGGSGGPIYYIDIDWQLWPQDSTWQGSQAIYFKSVAVYDLTTGTRAYFGVPGSSKSLSAIFSEIYSQLGIRSSIYIDNLQSDLSNYTFRTFNYSYYLMDIPQTIANKKYGNGSVIEMRFYEWDDASFSVKNYCNNIVIPIGPGQHRMVTSTTSGLKIETVSSAPSSTVPVTLAFDSTTNTLYIVQ